MSAILSALALVVAVLLAGELLGWLDTVLQTYLSKKAARIADHLNARLEDLKSKEKLQWANSYNKYTQGKDDKSTQ